MEVSFAASYASALVNVYSRYSPHYNARRKYPRRLEIDFYAGAKYVMR